MTWPVMNVIRILKFDPSVEDRPSSIPKAVVKADGSTDVKTDDSQWVELFVRILRSGTYLSLALFTYLFCFPLEEAKAAPLFSSSISTALKPGGYLRWVTLVFARNFLVEAITYGFWHWFLYESGWAAKFRSVVGVKFHPMSPDKHQLARERLFTTLGFCMSSLFEVYMINRWATGLPLMSDGDLLKYPIWTAIHILYIPYWRDFHFYVIHRFIHPWRFKILGVDPGKVLYHHVHSLHHKSVNTGPWSGLSMSPAEHFIYYSCTLLPLIFTLHPFMFLFNKFHADVSPAPGHDGYDQPAGGSLYHYLHHAHFETNYGTPMVPMDEWFGTREDGVAWRNRRDQDMKATTSNKKD